MSIYKNSLVLLFLCILFLACKKKDKSPESYSAPKEEVNSDSIPSNNEYLYHSKWKSEVNRNSSSISDLYAENAVKILEDGTIIEGNEAIEKHYLDHPVAIKTVKIDTFIEARKNRGLSYELGSYNIAANDFKQIIIWQSRDSTRKRVFEYTARIMDATDEMDDINKRRDQWISLCNQNNAANLINEMYSKNTLYYNHKPLIKGREALIREYGYMNREEYKLKLTPIINDQVNDKLVFEIGQCSGSYGGKYIIVWRKEDNGKWEVFIDSNI